MELFIFILGVIFLLKFKGDILTGYALYVIILLTTVAVHILVAYGHIEYHEDTYIANSLNGSEFAQPHVITKTIKYMPFSILQKEVRYDITTMNDLLTEEEKGEYYAK